ncbi:MAG TPA: hypothetical protein DCQ30_01595, partial [Acidimicrobiaceae bacterium]|nr:hypothetical protein [Acidimicrobiaceae bacterium]
RWCRSGLRRRCRGSHASAAPSAAGYARSDGPAHRSPLRTGRGGREHRQNRPGDHPPVCAGGRGRRRRHPLTAGRRPRGGTGLG